MATNIPVPVPRTYADFDNIDYRDMQDNVFDVLQMKLNPPLCYARRVANFNVANNTSSLMTWDYVMADTGPMLDLGVDGSRIIPNVAGRYKVNFGCYWQATGGNTAGRKVMWVAKNGVLWLRYEGRQTSSTDKALMGASGYISVNGTTDYLQFWTYQDSGVAINIGPYSTKDNTYMYIRWESAT